MIDKCIFCHGSLLEQDEDPYRYYNCGSCRVHFKNHKPYVRYKYTTKNGKLDYWSIIEVFNDKVYYLEFLPEFWKTEINIVSDIRKAELVATTELLTFDNYQQNIARIDKLLTFI